MPAAIHGVKTAEMRSSGWDRVMGGSGFMPRERQVSPRGAQMATRNRMKYWLGLRACFSEKLLADGCVQRVGTGPQAKRRKLSCMGRTSRPKITGPGFLMRYPGPEVQF